MIAHLVPREQIVGDAMTDRMWDMTVEHAEHCKRGDKVYVYNGVNSTIYVDSVFSRLLKIELNLVLVKSSLLQRAPFKSLVVQLVSPSTSSASLSKLAITTSTF